VYNVVVLCLIGVPTAFMIKEQIDAAYTLISLFTFFATTLTICLVFIPKVQLTFCQSVAYLPTLTISHRMYSVVGNFVRKSRTK